MGHLVGFPVTLGGFKVDGEGEDGLFRYDLPKGWAGADNLLGNYPDRNDALRPYECLILTKAD